MIINKLWGHCAECGHTFIVAHLPMELRKAAELAIRAACPKCASRKILCAKPEDVQAAAEERAGA